MILEEAKLTLERHACVKYMIAVQSLRTVHPTNDFVFYTGRSCKRVRSLRTCNDVPSLESAYRKATKTSCKPYNASSANRTCAIYRYKEVSSGFTNSRSRWESPNLC